MNQIAFTGPFSDSNFGDYAMLVNNIYDLNIKDIVLFTYDREFINTIKSNYLRDYDVRVVGVELEDSITELLDNHYPATPFELLSFVINIDELVEEMKTVDRLIVNGGGFLNGLWSMPHRIERLIAIIVPMLVATRLGKKIYFTSNSFGPFGDDAEFFACIFNALDDVTLCCRDDYLSPMWLKRIGIEGTKIKYLPDDLFTVHETLLKQEKTASLGSKEYAVLESYLPVEFMKENIETFKVFSREMFEKHGLNTVFLPFNLKQGGADQAGYLKEQLEYFQYYDIETEGYLPIRDAVEIIENASLVVCNRYHALVLALCCGTPVVNVLRDVLGNKLYYYNKGHGLLWEIFRGTAFDERLYLKSDLPDALDCVVNDYESIVSGQKEAYDDNYILNKERLGALRREHLKEITGAPPA